MMTRAKLLALSLAAAFVFGDIEFERAAVFGFNMFGDALRDLLDPRLRGGQ